MGCVSSKLFKKEEHHGDFLLTHVNYASHVVSLTSSTLGVLRLDAETPITAKEPEKRSSPSVASPELQKMVIEEPEVINAWELMGGLEDGIPISTLSKKSLKSMSPLQQVLTTKTPSSNKVFNSINSPKKQRRQWGKENKVVGGRFERTPSPSKALRPLALGLNSLERLQKIKGGSYNYKYSFQTTPNVLRKNSFKMDSGFSTSRRNLSPLFDPELLAMFERELSEGEEQIKMMVSPNLRGLNKVWEFESLLESYPKKSPPNGENTVVIYTTTLRGIRKTFEECNVVRSIIESHHIHMIERDISMDSGFREELRTLLEKKDVRVPVVFVKGRLIGGSEEVVKLEDEGKLSTLFDGIPRAMVGCEGCAGVRFIMCMDCCGSCRVLDPVEKKSVKCEECNENGLIQCPICC
ncbi:hypothetical protein GIB67_012801 [Kingdonia uniflora]|uniref:Glutaredoxin domain-containing protein n=1 Tax=Kingdonia uniflora TaxID=39325 RepID=A0A7J7NFV4_9MAGN|nr:hypothetical protein GIB67_012801 [Kingdonia uniflora]